MSDGKKLLAMCALQLATQNIEQVNYNLAENSNFTGKLLKIEGFISDYLKKEKN